MNTHLRKACEIKRLLLWGETKCQCSSIDELFFKLGGESCVGQCPIVQFEAREDQVSNNEKVAKIIAWRCTFHPWEFPQQDNFPMDI